MVKIGNLGYNVTWLKYYKNDGHLIMLKLKVQLYFSVFMVFWTVKSGGRKTLVYLLIANQRDD